MKKVFLIVFAIAITTYVVFGAGFHFKNYIMQFNGLPTFFDLFDEFKSSFVDIGNSWSEVGYGFSNVHDIVSFFVAFGNVFAALWTTISGWFYVGVVIPIKFVWFILQYAWAVIPHGNTLVSLS